MQDLSSQDAPSLPVRCGAGAWLAAPQNLVYLLLVAGCLVPIWSVSYIPTQDGPSHIYTATVLRNYDRPDCSAYRKYLEVSYQPDPNWVDYAALVGLMSFVSAPCAEKVLLTAYVLLLAFSMRYAVNAASRGPSFLSLLFIPFIYSYPLGAGFYNFCVSLAVYFFMMGYWLKWADSFGVRQAVVFAVLTLVAFFCHPFPLALAWVGIAVLGTWTAVRSFLQRRKQGGESLWLSAWQASRSPVVLPFLASLPAISLLGLFFLRQPSSVAYDSTTGLLRMEALRLVKLIGLTSLVSYTRTEMVLSCLMVLLVAVYIVGSVRVRMEQKPRGRLRPAMICLAGAYTVLYFAVPEWIFGGALASRLCLFPYFILILWIAMRPPRPDIAKWLAISAACISLAFLTVTTVMYIRLDRCLREYISVAPYIERNSTLLPICLFPKGKTANGKDLSARVQVFVHASGHVAAQRDAVDLSDYEACGLGFFPTRFRPAMDPFQNLADFSVIPPRGVDIVGYQARTGGAVDYVLIYGVSRSGLSDPSLKSIRDQLDQSYDPVTVPGTELVHLYRRRPAAEAARP